MKLFARTTVIVLTIITMTLGAAPSTPAKADYQTGVEAYSKGDFKTALNEWLPLAESGDATAQNAVGALYDHGLGVDEDDAAAVHWYQLAAEQNFPLAMRNLANMYAGGHGVPFDRAMAQSWYEKAAGLGDPVAIKHMAALSPSGTEFTAAPAAEPMTVAGESAPAEAAPAPAAEPMTVAGDDQAAETSPAPEAPAPAEAAPPPAPAAESPAVAATATDSDEAPQYGDTGASSQSASAASLVPATSQQAAVTPPAPPAASDPDNWLIGMWQGPSLGCPPGGGLEFLAGESRSYYAGQIAARLPAKYQVSGDLVTVTSTGVDGVGHSYQYERRDPNTFVIAAVPADMPSSMIGIEHHRCAGAPFAAAAASTPASAPEPAPAPAPAAQAEAAAPAPGAKPFVPAAPAPAKAPAPAAVPVKPVAEAPKLEPIAGAPQVAAKPQDAAPGRAQEGWDAFGRGDYKGALAIWQPLAESGDVSMQLWSGRSTITARACRRTMPRPSNGTSARPSKARPRASTRPAPSMPAARR